MKYTVGKQRDVLVDKLKKIVTDNRSLKIIESIQSLDIGPSLVIPARDNLDLKSYIRKLIIENYHHSFNQLEIVEYVYELFPGKDTVEIKLAVYQIMNEPEFKLNSDWRIEFIGFENVGDEI